MILFITAIFTGVLIAFLLKFSLFDFLHTTGSRTFNYRGREVINMAGLLFIPVWFIPVMLLSLIRSANVPSFLWASSILILGIGLCGLLDDLYGDRTITGLSGHLKSLVKGKITTGAIKAVFTPVIAIIAASVTARSLGQLLMDALIISLFVNTFNLLDLRPGRALKVFVVSALFLALYYNSLLTNYLGLILGASLILLPDELNEKVMLGDIGSNILGAMIGFTFIYQASFFGRLTALLLLLLLHLITERYSLSEFIAKNSFLRMLDEFGRKEK
jgi:UDP-N-acetylmuramyl pentapeptide phosphotransferase/UDP-N-acetylglucosamine-1-phosphate transferase